MTHLKIFALAFAISIIAGHVGCSHFPLPVPVDPNPPVATPKVVPTLSPGFTLEDVSQLPDILKLLDSLPSKPTVRIVLQRDDNKWTPMMEYAAAYQVIKPRANVIIAIVDSEFDRACDSACYAARAKEAAEKFPGAAIEGGNELNGTSDKGDPWLSNDTHAHFIAAAKATKVAGNPLLLNLYSELPETYAAWSDKLPAEIRAMVDYLTISSYPADNPDDDGNPHPLDAAKFAATMSAKYPNARIAIGETWDTKCWTRKVDHPKWDVWCGLWQGSEHLTDTRFIKLLGAALQ